MKITLNNVANLQDTTTAANTINSNNAVIQTAFDNTLSRDGTQPNTMGSNLDMNAYQIINLPAPNTSSSPVRVQDIAPASQLSPLGGLNINVSGAIISTITNPVFSGGVTTPSLVNTGTLTLPTSSDTLVGRATTDTLTNKTLTAPVLGGTITGTYTIGGTPSIPASAITSGTISSARVPAVSLGAGNTNGGVSGNLPVVNLNSGTSAGSSTFWRGDGTWAIPPAGGVAGQLAGTATNDNASAGNVGEYVESVIVAGSALSLTTSTAKTITSITLTAGDWDVSGNVNYGAFNGTTSITRHLSTLSLTTNTLDITSGRSNDQTLTAVVPANGASMNGVIQPCRFSLAGSVTIFLIGFATFTASTLTAYGIIRARRIR